MSENKGRVLVIAGSDSGGGAGIQADTKTITALGGFATTAITALTAQNTTAVTEIHAPPPEFLNAQINAVYDDIGADAVKLGMLHDTDTINTAANFLARARSEQPGLPVVADPVMFAAAGARLLRASAEQALAAQIIPLATVLTPNLPEAEHLLAREIRHDSENLAAAARDLRKLGAENVLLKGGHLQDNNNPAAHIIDTLAGADGEIQFRHRRLPVRGAAHGTGCTLASAVATRLAFGDSVSDAVEKAREYVRGAIAHAQGFGHGATPLHHGWRSSA
ncbi:MAG: bifunctional hydroxymethylpyrimidine kinase/phosphomethylpyrimidine kinase [Alphaproteobacteria bacterium]|nr:bifunctional hydroxymethylpyrimidine kinase/phosphomethylpyrimidine kinase [Alphaproteobacteria bacterium]MDA7983033.1 bifunctional hydroxymethylpyrimidine kinase/phosphomethylpyrimidine kinase [Alphaproteobacteria bacterium]